MSTIRETGHRIQDLEPKLLYNPRYEINELIKSGDLKRLLVKAAELHGHFCVGLAQGVKASLIALKRLGIDLPVKDVSEHVRQELVAIVDNNLCFIDGVQMIIGTTLGNNSLIFRDAGKLSLTLVDRKSRRAVRVSLIKRIETPTVNDPRFNEYFRRAMIRRERLAPHEWEEFRSLMDKASFEVLYASEDEHFHVEELKIGDLSGIESIERLNLPGKWVKCKGCGVMLMESKARREGEDYYCVDCTGEGSYAVIGRRIEMLRIKDLLGS